MWQCSANIASVDAIPADTEQQHRATVGHHRQPQQQAVSVTHVAKRARKESTTRQVNNETSVTYRSPLSVARMCVFFTPHGVVTTGDQEGIAGVLTSIVLLTASKQVIYLIFSFSTMRRATHSRYEFASSSSYSAAHMHVRHTQQGASLWSLSTTELTLIRWSLIFSNVLAPIAILKEVSLRPTGQENRGVWAPECFVKSWIFNKKCVR